MLLAHEYTHWIREKEIKHDIFENCIGERFITEGIACNFSEEVVPNKQKSYYTIVPNTTVEWVENNLEVIDKVVEPELNKNNMMYDHEMIYEKLNQEYREKRFPTFEEYQEYIECTISLEFNIKEKLMKDYEGKKISLRNIQELSIKYITKSIE